MNAIHGTGVNACRVLGANARLCNYVGHMGFSLLGTI
jgi:hypothetical protein